MQDVIPFASSPRYLVKASSSGLLTSSSQELRDPQTRTRCLSVRSALESVGNISAVRQLLLVVNQVSMQVGPSLPRSLSHPGATLREDPCGPPFHLASTAAGQGLGLACLGCEPSNKDKWQGWWGGRLHPPTPTRCTAELSGHAGSATW